MTDGTYCRAPQNVFCIWACQIYSFQSPPALSPTASLTWNQWREKGYDKEKLRNLKFVWRLFPWTFHTVKQIMSWFHSNRKTTCYIIQRDTHTQNKNRIKTTAQIKIFKEAIEWGHEAFLSTNCLTWTLSITKLILCTLPSFLWGKQSQNGYFSDSTFQKTQTF